MYYISEHLTLCTVISDEIDSLINIEVSSMSSPLSGNTAGVCYLWYCVRLLPHVEGISCAMYICLSILSELYLAYWQRGLYLNVAQNIIYSEITG